MNKRQPSYTLLMTSYHVWSNEGKRRKERERGAMLVQNELLLITD